MQNNFLPFSYLSPQTVNGWIYQAAREPNRGKFIKTMEDHVKPTKPLAYASLMGLDLACWTHHAGPQDTAIADQTTSNPVEQNMSMIGADVSVIIVCCLAGAWSVSLRRR